MKRIDLRSDTVTKPTPAMLAAMMKAEVGDDIYGEDPTTNALQEEVADLFGKEAGLFVPTGSMGNQLSLKSHTSPGDEVIVESECHIFHYETGGPAVWSGVQLYPVRGEFGVPTVEAIGSAMRPPEYYYPATRLVCLENTHNRAGGAIFPIERMREIRALCLERGFPLHLDGARIWNAHVATGIPLREYGALVDSVNVCFSKGLGAPIGSMLLGTKAFIAKAHRYRKMFGGAMRQVGVIAEAARYALQHHIERLAQDHANTRRFAERLSGKKSFTIDMAGVQTNMVMLDFSGSAIDPYRAQERMAELGVAIGHGRQNMLRAVFHLDVSASDTDEAIQRIDKAFE